MYTLYSLFECLSVGRIVVQIKIDSSVSNVLRPMWRRVIDKEFALPNIRQSLLSNFPTQKSSDDMNYSSNNYGYSIRMILMTIRTT